MPPSRPSTQPSPARAGTGEDRHVMNDHVSFGSQPQYRPQVCCAQIAPQITPKVQIGNPNWMKRYASRSSVAEGGRAIRRAGSAGAADPTGSSAPDT